MSIFLLIVVAAVGFGTVTNGDSSSISEEKIQERQMIAWGSGLGLIDGTQRFARILMNGMPVVGHVLGAILVLFAYVLQVYIIVIITILNAWAFLQSTIVGLLMPREYSEIKLPS